MAIEMQMPGCRKRTNHRRFAFQPLAKSASDNYYNRMEIIPESRNRRRYIVGVVNANAVKNLRWKISRQKPCVHAARTRARARTPPVKIATVVAFNSFSPIP